MHARLFPLWGALLLGALGGPGCNDKGPTGGPTPPDGSSPDGGTQPPWRTGASCLAARTSRATWPGSAGAVRARAASSISSETAARAAAASEAKCDPVAQNCPGGQRCTYARGDGGTFRTCVAEGTVDELGACQLASSEPLGVDTCKKGLFCVDMPKPDGGDVFLCGRLCHGTATCAAPRGECNEVLRLSGTTELPLFCGTPSQRCDLLAQNCEGPLSCYPANSTALCATTGNLAEGAPCEFSNQCARGSACVRTGTGLTCRTLCRLPSGPPSCPTGRRCEALQGIPGAGACIP